MGYLVTANEGWRDFLRGEWVTREELGVQFEGAMRSGAFTETEHPPKLSFSPVPLPYDCPRWITMAGAWGDCLISLGTAQAIKRKFPDDPMGIIWAGRDTAVTDFLAQQQYRGKLLFSDAATLDCPQDNAAYWSFVSEFCADEGSPSILKAAGFDAAEVFQGHITKRMMCSQSPIIADEVHISHKCRHESAYLLDHYNTQEDFILALPWSHQSTWLNNFAVCTEELFRRIGDEVDLPVIVAGQKHKTFSPEITCFADLRDVTTSNEVVFALADKAKLVVCTCNSLAHYCAIKGIPCIVLPNKEVQMPHDVFRRHLLQSASIKMMSYRASADEVLLEIRSCLSCHR